MPGSRLSFVAAKSNRAAWASQGFVSCSRVRVCMLWFLFSSAGISDSPAIVCLHLLEARIRLSQTGLWPNSRSIGWRTEDRQSNEWGRLTPFSDRWVNGGRRSIGGSYDWYYHVCFWLQFLPLCARIFEVKPEALAGARLSDSHGGSGDSGFRIFADCGGGAGGFSA